MKTSMAATLTLEEVPEQFDQWRRNKKRGERIPQRLGCAAIGLLWRYPITQITRTLHLSGADLSKHQAVLSADKDLGGSGPPVSFVEIEEALVDQALRPKTPLVSMELERAALGAKRQRIRHTAGADATSMGAWLGP
jgi:hypothetical protein